MYSIKFSHYYNKMKAFDLSRSFKLVGLVRTDKIGDILKEYDATYDGGRYPIPDGEVMILILEQDGKLMTTIRRYTPSKAEFYSELLGQQVMCVVNEK